MVMEHSPENDMGKTCVTFVIPVLHPDNASNWAKVRSDLCETVYSLLQQTSYNWAAVIVANHEADLPDFPDPVRILRVDLPHNPKFDRSKYSLEESYRATRLNKGHRILAGALSVRGSTRYMMVVDNDDFVSRDLVAFVERNDGCDGWYFAQGFVWEENSGYVVKTRGFSMICGTCQILRIDNWRLPESAERADVDYISTMLGNHRAVHAIMEQAGTPLAPLPFPGAIYRVGNSESVSKSRSPLRKRLFSLQGWSEPRTLLRMIAGLRPLSQKVRDQYGMQ